MTLRDSIDIIFIGKWLPGTGPLLGVEVPNILPTLTGSASMSTSPGVLLYLQDKKPAYDISTWNLLNIDSYWNTRHALQGRDLINCKSMLFI
jgi:hypothetical protein